MPGLRQPRGRASLPTPSLPGVRENRVGLSALGILVVTGYPRPLLGSRGPGTSGAHFPHPSTMSWPVYPLTLSFGYGSAASRHYHRYEKLVAVGMLATASEHALALVVAPAVHEAAYMRAGWKLTLTPSHAAVQPVTDVCLRALLRCYYEWGVYQGGKTAARRGMPGLRQPRGRASIYARGSKKQGWFCLLGDSGLYRIPPSLAVLQCGLRPSGAHFPHPSTMSWACVSPFLPL